MINLVTLNLNVVQNSSETDLLNELYVYLSWAFVMMKEPNSVLGMKDFFLSLLGNVPKWHGAAVEFAANR